MNINKTINAKNVKMVTLKQRKKNAFIAIQKKMEDMLVPNVNMKKMIKALTLKILSVKAVIQLIHYLIKIVHIKL